MSATAVMSESQADCYDLVENLEKTQSCALMAAKKWVHQAEISKSGLSSSFWVHLLQWLTFQIPVNKEGCLLFYPRLLDLNIKIQKALLSILIENVHKLHPDGLANFLQSMQTYSITDSWLTELFNILREKGYPSNKTVYQFTDESQALYSTLLDTMKMKEAGKSIDAWDITLQSGSQAEYIQSRTPLPRPESSETCGASISQQSKTTILAAEDSEAANDVSQEGPAAELNPLDALEEKLEVEVAALQEAWHADRLDPNIPPTHIQCLVTLTTQQLDLVFLRLKLALLPEASLSAVCHHVVWLGEQLSHTSATRFAHACLFPRVAELSQNASRALFGAVSIFATSFPQPSIEGILIPGLTQPNAGGPQSDLVTRIAREVFKPQSRVDLFRKLSETHDKWNEAVLSVVRTMLDLKTPADGLLLTGLVEQLIRVSADLSSSKQLAKVVLTIVQKLDQQLTPANVAGLKQVLQKNTTFLKKSAMAALSRLKI